MTAGEIGWTVVGAVAVATAAHGIGRYVRDHIHPPAAEMNDAEKEADAKEGD